jgi:hypothetical protein
VGVPECGARQASVKFVLTPKMLRKLSNPLAHRSNSIIPIHLKSCALNDLKMQIEASIYFHRQAARKRHRKKAIAFIGWIWHWHNPGASENILGIVWRSAVMSWQELLKLLQCADDSLGCGIHKCPFDERPWYCFCSAHRKPAPHGKHTLTAAENLFDKQRMRRTFARPRPATLRAQRLGAAWNKSVGRSRRRPLCLDWTAFFPERACGHGLAKLPRTRKIRSQTR